MTDLNAGRASGVLIGVIGGAVAVPALIGLYRGFSTTLVAVSTLGVAVAATLAARRAYCRTAATSLELVIPLGARLGHPKWRKALKDAGVDAATSQDVVERIADSYVPWQENSFPGLLGNVAAGRIANKFDLGGTNCVVDAACASSLSAVHMAAMELHSGQSDMVITGGVDTFNDIFMFMCFSKTPALSPTGDCRPFSNNADGSILGEGIGCRGRGAPTRRVEPSRSSGAANRCRVAQPFYDMAKLL